MHSVPRLVLAGLALLAAGAEAAAAAPAAPGAAASTAAPAVDASSPSQLIETAAQAMLKELDANRAAYRSDPSKVHQLVDQILLPHFDTEYSARLVLGRHWLTANADQRKRFVDAFYKSLLDNYGDALVDFTGDRLKVFPFNGDPKADSATVRTQVKKNDGTFAQVNYSMRRTDQGWKAWDVVIEGISYVKSFRDDFGAEIDQKGLDELIQRLESNPATVSKPAQKAS